MFISHGIFQLWIEQPHDSPTKYHVNAIKMKERREKNKKTKNIHTHKIPTDVYVYIYINMSSCLKSIEFMYEIEYEKGMSKRVYNLKIQTAFHSIVINIIVVEWPHNCRAFVIII